jgi:hypothetical protein
MTASRGDPRHRPPWLDRLKIATWDHAWMPSVFEQSIIVGSSRIIGDASVDGGAVRGEGGPMRPQLLVPVTLQLNQRPDESAIAVVELRAQLSTEQNATHQVCAPVTESLMAGFPARSLPSGTRKYTAWLRFFLTQAEVTDLELRRQSGPGEVFSLYLSVEPTVAAIKTFNGQGPDGTWQESPFETSFGLHSQLQPFWNASIAQLTVQIEPSSWVRDVLPGLGYDRLRLMELTFPPPLPGHLSAAKQFDKARRALDERRNGACIQECRGLLNMWEKQYGATTKKRLADQVAAVRGWPADDVRRDLLDLLWKEVGDVANAPHHPEGNVDAELFDSRDARLVLLLTAALSEYVEPR